MHLCGGAPPCKEANLLLAADPREADRQLKRRERNRVAAQRSRHKHTEKADGLHQEHEWLEKANQILRKEIWSLQAEVKEWLRTLEEHQRVCLLTAVPGSAQTQQLPRMGQGPPPLQAPASPSAGPPPAAAVQAPPPPGFSIGSFSSSLPPLAALTQTHGSPSLPASSPSWQSAPPLPRNPREGMRRACGGLPLPPPRGLPLPPA